ncbi:NUDIX hydrolase [Demequina aurantiaca]|uniref:NUDIX hydrolase n=1 Tax=Demequina aurantiaca TaxID=676200 RepID=UPI00078569CC|nr:NUDIX domain-containing protein [Demequina aurantiaca]
MVASPVAREAARVLLFDASGRILLLQGHDPAQPGRHWWFTPGGGLEAGESHPEAAVRELAEETGFVISVDQLVGPVWERSALFDFMETPFVQHEEFFMATLAADAVAGSLAWTDTETDTIDESRWFSITELRDVTIEIFPTHLRHLLTTVTPWDGQLRHLGEEHA